MRTQREYQAQADNCIYHAEEELSEKSPNYQRVMALAQMAQAYVALGTAVQRSPHQQLYATDLVGVSPFSSVGRAAD